MVGQQLTTSCTRARSNSGGGHGNVDTRAAAGLYGDRFFPSLTRRSRGSGGAAGSDGADASDGPPPPFFPSCQPVVVDSANMLDFNMPETGSVDGKFGNYPLWGGGTYVYPEPTLTQEYSTMTWHIT